MSRGKVGEEVGWGPWSCLWFKTAEWANSFGLELHVAEINPVGPACLCLDIFFKDLGHH
jgi:hypothetical protein